ncbi:tandem-95 repeat protein [Pontibacterium sp. N1Y112]|uniref:Tandem-95 repeat protein n=1 Tax=Pontibacterium sinense TaxID=2781979 RepID=A0A8J7K098_9GAMM|nr:Ig-like domain-containing protein [Pontibacterium sinense]MBE9398759.1 tandem-95 repeat protein [Pontibacterium sinense]
MTLKAPTPTHTLATLGLTSALLFTSSFAVSAPHHDHDAPQTFASSSEQRATTEVLTQNLVNEHRLWAQSRGNGKKIGLNRLIEQAESRQAVLAELVKYSPSDVLNVAIDSSMRESMPEALQNLLEQDLELEGEVEALYEHTDDGSYTLRQFVKTSSGDRFELHTAGKGKNLRHGQKVSVDGLLIPAGDDHENIDGSIALASADDILIMGATSGDNGGSASVLPNTFGERKVAVLLVNFQNDSSNKPWSHSQIQNVVFGEVSDFFSENSYQQTWLNGDVLGWYTVPVDSNNCPSNYYSYADQAATSSGVNLSGYDHIIYMIPPGSNCPSTNAGTVGGSPSRAWISAATDARTVAHEFGHNLGLHHAHGLNCEGDVLSSNCRQYTYGDAFDVMGTKYGHLNAMNKERLGWLGHNQSPPIATITSDGTYTISPMSPNSSATKALKISKGIDPATGQQSWYYIEYRQPVGFDDGIFGTGTYDFPENIANGVLVHKAIEGDGNSSDLLDMTPDSVAKSGSYDLRDGALEVGHSYTDNDAGVTIMPLSNDANGITVSVSFNGNGGGGTTNTAPVAVNDSANTAAGSAVTIPALSNDYDMDGDNLAITGTSGVNGSAQVSGGNIVYTPNTGFSGIETFSYTISDGNGASDTGTVSVNVAAAPSNSAPVAWNDTATTDQGSAVTIPVLSNDYDADGDTISITGTSGVYGSIQISGGNILFTPVSGFSGTENFTYAISDGHGGTDTATVTVTVNASSTNSAPVAVYDSVQITSKTSVSIPVLSNDYDPDSDAITIVGITQGNKGSVSISNGQLMYTPGRRFKNNDTFTYTISDGTLTATAQVQVQLNADSGNTGGSGGGKGNGKNK